MTRLFISDDAHPRDRHSFPTRRSSDLDGHLGPLELLLAGGHGVDQVGQGPGQLPHLVAAPADRLQPLGQRPRRRLQDRKSTRLNSSHSQISYAVFCLKKKKSYVTEAKI